MQALSLDILRQVFRDQEVALGFGVITQVEISTSRSEVACMVKLFMPENKEIVATMTWGATSDGGGDYQLPDIGDQVLLGFAYNEIDYAFIIGRLSSASDRVPVNAGSGDRIIKAKTGKNVWLSADGKIYLARGDTAPTQPVPLGGVLKTLLSDILGQLATLSTALETHTHIGAGLPADPSAFAAAKTFFNGKKASPVDNNDMNSNVVFTEKG